MPFRRMHFARQTTSNWRDDSTSTRTASAEQGVINEHGRAEKFGDVNAVERVTSRHGSSTQSDAELEVAEQRPDDDAQAGVKRVEAITLTWSKPTLIAVYILMFTVYMTNAFQSSITGNLTSYILSEYQSHSLIAVIYIVSNVMSAATYLPVAKICNVFGRAQAFTAMASFATFGLILTAATNSVEMYAAAQIFYSIGFPGMIFSIDVITSDTSSLRDRGLAFAFTSSPYMITAFAGPAAAEGFYDLNWRWAYGMFAIILPAVATPLVIIMVMNTRKARASGLLQEAKASGRTWTQSIWYYAIELDVLGVVILAAGLVLFLLPFSIASSTADDWRSPRIISMLVLGFVLLVSFPFVERYLAPKPFVPYHLLVSRTILGTCLLDASWQVAYYCWASYFSSYLQVVNGLTITQAGWIGGVFDVISGVWLFIVGYLIRRTGRFKWLFLAAVPLYTLGVGLMIYFRQPGTNIGYIIMTQIFIAFAGSTLILCQQVSVLSVAEHNDTASVLALLGLFGYVGGGVGNSISGAIWTHTLPQALQRLLPTALQPEWEAIYGDLTKQLSYPMGTAARTAIIAAYAVAQRRMLIAGCAVMIAALISVLFIKDVRVNRQQMKGMVL